MITLTRIMSIHNVAVQGLSFYFAEIISGYPGRVDLQLSPHSGIASQGDAGRGGAWARVGGMPRHCMWNDVVHDSLFIM